MNRCISYLRYLGSLLSRVVLLPLYFLSGFFPRRPDVWVFGSWGGYRYSDNAAAFFEYCEKTIASRIRLIWISRDRKIVRMLRNQGKEAHWIWSPGGIYSCLSARLYLFDSFSKDINTWLSRGATKINLWSGVPLKKCEREIDNPRSRYYRLFHGSLPERIFLSAMMPWHAIRPDYVIATSELTRDITCKSFDIPRDRVWVTGYPRNDALLNRNNNESEQIDNLTQELSDAIGNGKTIILYLPTYRDSGKDFIEIDWNALDDLMSESNALFVYKFHPDHVGGAAPRLPNVLELPKAADIYSVLSFTDALISDYSSIIFDYMLLNLPIIYYVPDLREFSASSRSLNFQPEEIAAGPLCENWNELSAALSGVINDSIDSHNMTAKWDQTRKRFNAHVDGQCSRRVLEAIARNVTERNSLQPALEQLKSDI